MQARSKVGFRGTARYASLRAHQGKVLSGSVDRTLAITIRNQHIQELGRVDDLWSLFYVIVEFLKGSLPWRGREKVLAPTVYIPKSHIDKQIRNQEKIGDLKTQYTNRSLVSDLPQPMTDLYLYLLSLSYADPPDYEFIQSIFQSLLNISGKTWDTPYDWELLQSDEEFTMATSSDVVGAAGLVTTRETIATVPSGVVVASDRGRGNEGGRVFEMVGQVVGGMDAEGDIAPDAKSEGEVVEPTAERARRSLMRPLEFTTMDNNGKSSDDLRMLLRQLPDSLHIDSDRPHQEKVDGVSTAQGQVYIEKEVPHAC